MSDENQEQGEKSVADQMESRASKGSKKKGGKKAAKKATKKASKKGEGAIKKVGVIAVIVELISRAEGASTSEIVKELVKRFPERDEKGMTTTVRIQVTRLPKRFEFEMKKKKDEDRGLVYKAPASLPSRLAKGKKEAEAE